VRDYRRLIRWDKAVADYLENRRVFGRKYSQEEWMLRSLRGHLVAAHATDLDQDRFDCWRTSFKHLNANTRRAREQAVYKFCVHRRRSEPRCFLPNPLCFSRRRPHAMPTIIDAAQIARLLKLASELQPTPQCPIYPQIVRLALILLYTAGLRRGELIRLRLQDIDPGSGVIRIRESKFHKSRWIPLSQSTRRELRQYLSVRRKLRHGTSPSAPLLFNGRRAAVCYTGTGISRGITQLFIAANLRDGDGRRPRIHDLRHSFAVGALLRWYQCGADVQSNLPKLALYMGHVSIVSTAYYLRFMPAVLAQASQRFARSCAGVVDGGAP
jgi:integrase/recombinase XerD